jgi:hypothetical protein
MQIQYVMIKHCKLASQGTGAGKAYRPASAAGRHFNAKAQKGIAAIDHNRQ